MKNAIALLLLSSTVHAELVLKWDRPIVTPPAVVVQESTTTTTKINNIDRRLTEIENAPGPVTIQVVDAKTPMPLPLSTLRMLDEKLKPRMLESAAKINNGTYTKQDIAMIAAGYNTYRDQKGLRDFCRQMLVEKFDLRGEGMREWLTGVCSK